MLNLLRLLTLIGLWEKAKDPAAAEEEEDETGEEPEEEEVRDPAAKIHSLEDHVKRLHKRLEERDSRIKELEEAAGHTDNGPTYEAAFWRELAIGELRIGDHESAWDLFTARGFADLVKVSAEGEVSGMEAALAKLVDRYPWLADEPALSDGDADVHMRRSASPPKRPIKESQFSSAQLQDRYPHLRRHR